MRRLLPFLLFIIATDGAIAGPSYTPITRPSTVPQLSTYLRTMMMVGNGQGFGVRVPPADGPTWVTPTVSGVSASDAITGFASISFVVNSGNGVNNTNFRYWNSEPYVWRGTLLKNQVPQGENANNGTVTAEFTTDAQYLEYVFRNNGGSQRIWVDGHLVGQEIGESSTGATDYRLITFATRAIRNVRIEMDKDYFSAIHTYPFDSVWYPTTPQPLTCIIEGDSYTTGTVGDGGVAYNYYDYAQWMGELLGWNVVCSGAGGTGFQVADSGKLTYPQRATPAANEWHVNLGGASSGSFTLNFNGSASAAADGYNDVQTTIQGNLNSTFGVTVNAQPSTGGTFTLHTVTGNHTTTTIAPGASASTVATDLTSASITGATVTLVSAGIWNITGVNDTWTIASSLTGGTIVGTTGTVQPNLTCTGDDAQDFILTPCNSLASVMSAPTITSNTLAYAGTYSLGSATITAWGGEIVPYNPDIVVVAGGYNDRTCASSVTQAAATTMFQTLKSELPNTLFIEVGPWSPNGTPTYGTEPSDGNTALALQAANTAASFSPLFINTFNPSTGGSSWITGATTTSGTHDYWVEVPTTATAFTLTVGSNVATVTQGDAATCAQVAAALTAAAPSAITYSAVDGVTGGPFYITGVTAAAPTIAITGGSGSGSVTAWAVAPGNAIYYIGGTDSTHPASPGTNFNGIGGHQFEGYQIASDVVQYFCSLSGLGGN